MTVEINCADIELHLQSDSRHGLAFFSDLGKNKYTLRRVGGVIHSTTQIKAGGTSFYSPAGDGDYLRVEGKKENFNFIHQATSSWTIQTWCYLSATNNTSSTIMGNSWNGASHDGFRFHIDHSTNGSVPTFTTYVNWTSSQGYKSSEIKANQSIPLNTWVHLAVVYDSDNETFMMYIDGQDKTAPGNTWSANRLLRSPGKSLDIFRDDVETPNGFHGFLQDIQIVSKAVYLVNFTKGDQLMFDRCSPATVNLKIPGRPEYIYYFDGETTKCYRKTNARVYEGGLTLTEDHIAASVDQHAAEKAEKPVLIYDSCEQCLGLSEFFTVASFGTIIRYGNISVADVQNMTPGGPLVDIDTYTVEDASVTVMIDDIGNIDQYYPDNPDIRFADRFYQTGKATVTVTVRDVASHVPGVTNLDPSDVSIPRPIYTFRTTSRTKALSITIQVGAETYTGGAFPSITTAGNITGNKPTRKEGTTSTPAPPDYHGWDAENDQIVPKPFIVTNNPGAWVSFTR